MCLDLINYLHWIFHYFFIINHCFFKLGTLESFLKKVSINSVFYSVSVAYLWVCDFLILFDEDMFVYLL